MGRRHAAHDDPVADLDMAAERRLVAHDDVVADDAVVADVCGGHQETVRTDTGLGAGPVRAVDRDVLAQHVAIADPDPGVGAVVGRVLRQTAEHAVRADGVVLANAGKAMDHGVRAD